MVRAAVARREWAHGSRRWRGAMGSWFAPLARREMRDEGGGASAYAPAAMFELLVEGSPLPIEVAGFSGREAMSKRYRFDVDVVLDAEPREVELTYLGRSAILALDTRTPEARRVGGLVRGVTWLGALSHGTQRFRFELRPRLDRLSRSRTSRIFQGVGATAIAEELLRLHGVPFRFALSREPEPRTYCVQYRETDLAFVTRLFAEEGLFYYFEDPGVGGLTETLVIADSPIGYLPVPGLPLIVREATPGMSPEENHVREVRHARRAGFERARHTAYDPERPSHELTSEHSSGLASAQGALGAVVAELGGSAGSLSTAGPAPRAGRWDEHDEDPSPGGPHRPSAATWTRAKVTVEQLERKARRLHGETLCRRLAPGHVIAIADHDSTTYDGPYVLSAVRHVGIDPRQAGGREPYQATFEGAPATVALRPKPASRRLVQVAETARVIGPPGAQEGEIHTDKLGRVRVELPWDAGDRPTGRASCWMRVVQAWAGAGFGTQFVPRVGMEVLVVFLGGDPDRPVITGALPNTEHLPPFDLPAAATTSGIRTQSVGGKGYNELVFVDTPGGELVRLRGESAVEIEASGPLALRSVGERLDASIGSRTTTVTGDDKLGIDGDLSVEIMGAESTFVFGDVTRSTLGRSSLRAVGPISHETEAGFFAKADGPVLLDAGTDVTLSSGPGNGVIQLAAGGAFYAQSGREIQLIAAERIVLAVGTTKLEISADGVKVAGTDLVLEASGTLSASGPGPSLKLGEEAEMTSKAITLTSEDAQVTLTKTAEIKCADIKLGGKKKQEDEEKKPEETKKKPLELKLTDYDLEPYADKHYEVFAGGEKLEGTTTIDGELKVEVPETATTAFVKVWIDLYPEGRTRQYNIELGKLAPASEPRGAKERLKNLGYYSGPIDDELGPGGVAALEWFQRDHELEPTGELDGKTVSKLEEVHGE